MKFVKINNRILDYDKHKRELVLVKNHLMIQIFEILKTYGFEKDNHDFFNKDLNLKISLKFEKIEEEVFV